MLAQREQLTYSTLKYFGILIKTKIHHQKQNNYEKNINDCSCFPGALGYV